MLAPGLSHTSRLLVAQGDTASAQGSGDMPVLATPRLIALMENAALQAVAPALDEGMTTVGGEISVKHLAPSPVGATIEAHALLVSVEGRKLTFDLSARQLQPADEQGGKLVGEGTHVRFIVHRQKFLDKL